MKESLMVYENTSKGSLARYLRDLNLTWTKQLEICTDVACRFDFLHGGDVTQEVVVHRSIIISSILLDGELEARISDIGLSVLSSIGNEVEFNIIGTCIKKHKEIQLERFFNLNKN